MKPHQKDTAERNDCVGMRRYTEEQCNRAIDLGREQEIWLAKYECEHCDAWHLKPRSKHGRKIAYTTGVY